MPSEDYSDLVEFSNKMHEAENPTSKEAKVAEAPRKEVPRPGDPSFWQKAAGYIADHGAALGKGLLQGASFGAENKLAGLGAMMMGDKYEDGVQHAKQFYKPQPGTEMTQHAGQFLGGAPAAMALGAGAGGVVAKSLPSLLPAQAARATGLLGGMTAGGLAGAGSSEAPTMGGQLHDAAVGADLGAGMQMAGEYGGKALAMAKAKAMELGGKAAQLPQRAYEAVAEKVGPMIPEELRGSGKVHGMKSAQVKALERIASQGRMGEDAGAYAAAQKAGGDVLSKPFSELDGEQMTKFESAVTAGLKDKGIKASPEMVKAKIGQLVGASGGDVSDMRSDDVLRLIIKHDPANVAKRVMTSGQAYEGLVDQQDPRWGSMVSKAGGLRGDYEAGKLNRGFGQGEDPKSFDLGMQGKPGYAPPARPPPTPPEAEAQRMSMPRQATGTDGGSSPMSRQPGVNTTSADGPNPIDMAKRRAMKIPGFKLEDGGFSLSKEGLNQSQHADLEAMSSLGHEASAVPQSSQREVAEDAAKQADKVQATQPWNADKAREAESKLRNIAYGRRALDFVGGGGLGGAIGGIPGAIAGAGLGHHAIDVAGAGGQALERMGREEMLKVASRSNNAQLQRGAAWVMDGAKQSGKDGLVSRSFILQMQPWFREAMSDHLKKAPEESPDSASDASVAL